MRLKKNLIMIFVSICMFEQFIVKEKEILGKNNYNKHFKKDLI